MTSRDPLSQKRVLLTSGRYPNLHPLATVLHDANNKLTPIMAGVGERRGVLEETDFLTCSNAVKNIRDKVQELLEAVRVGAIDTNKCSEYLTQLHGRLGEILPFIQDTEVRRLFVSRNSFECAVNEFDMLMERGLNFIQAQPPEDKPIPGNISEFVLSIVLDYQHRYPHIRFQSSIEANCSALFHPLSIKRALENLLINAIQALPEEGGKISIMIRDRFYDTEGKPFAEIEDGPYISIEIEDNGSGIPEDVLDELRHSPVTTRKDGSGFGLVSARKSLIRHKGHLMIESEEGHGVKATALLPSSHPPPRTTSEPDDEGGSE
ncbi:MAG: ATP-binding protein [Patescibacteria group bacterium]